MTRQIKIGDPITYVDEYGVPHAALVTANWGNTEYDDSDKVWLSINILYVSGNADETDQYGRQIKRETSVVHKSTQTAPGRYWFQT